jgi:anti-sigma factor RsiW
MNCKEVHPQLSEFLDRSLDARSVEGIENHLIACPNCRAELASLAECQRLVARLPEMAPPLGFTTRVMANVREAAQQPSWWERIFLLPSKIPLSATAVILIGMLSIYVYQKEASDNLPLTSSSSTERSLPRSEDASIPEKAEPAPRANQKGSNIAPVAKAQGVELANPILRAAPSAKLSTPAAPVAAPAVRDIPLEDKIEKSRSAPIPAQGVTASPDGIWAGNEAAGFGAPPPIGALRQPAGRSAADRSLAIQGEPVADYEIVVRRRPIQRRDQAPTTSSLDALQKGAESDVAPNPVESRKRPERLAAPASSMPVEIIWYSVPHNSYEQFKKELAGQAAIESENAIVVKEKDPSFSADRPLAIKVTVLPALDR